MKYYGTTNDDSEEEEESHLNDIGEQELRFASLTPGFEQEYLECSCGELIPVTPGQRRICCENCGAIIIRHDFQ